MKRFDFTYVQGLMFGLKKSIYGENGLCLPKLIGFGLDNK